MQAVERLSSYITRGVYTVSGPFHPFGGAVDIIVVQQQDGSFKSSPWYIRFGKFQGVLKTKEKVVNIRVNGTEAGFHMFLDHKGEAYFLEDPDSNEGEFVMSPPTSGDETDGQTKNGPLNKVLSCDFDNKQTESVAKIDMENAKIVARTNSRRSKFFGLMFGQRSMKKDDSVRNVQRVSSLERAEIAADLLEMKWSTNLPTNTRRAGSSLKKPREEGGRDVNMVEKEQSSSSLSSNAVFNYNGTVGSNSEGIDDNFGSNIVSTEHFDEITSYNNPHLRTHEEVIEVYSSESGNTFDRREVISNTLAPKADEFDTASKVSVFRNPIGDMLCSNSAEISSDTERSSDKSGVRLPAAVPMEECGDGEVSSFIYCETLESSSVRFNVSDSLNFDTLNLSLGGSEQVQINSDVSGETSEITYEVNSGLEDGASTGKENSSISDHENLQMYSDGNCAEAANVTGVVFESSIASSIAITSPISGAEELLPESLSSVDLHLLRSESIETDAVEVIQKDAANKKITQEKGMGAKSIEVFEKQSQNDEQLNSVEQLDVTNEKIAQEKGTDAKPRIFLKNQSQMEKKESTFLAPAPVFEIDQHLNSGGEAELQRICMVPDSCNSNDEVEKAGKLGGGVKMDKCDIAGDFIVTEESGANSHQAEVANASIPFSGSLEDAQSSISDINNFGVNQHPEQLTIAKAIGTEDHLLLSPEGTTDENESIHINPDPSFKVLSEASRNWTSPISIPKSRTHVEGTERLVRSLPNIHSHIHDLESTVVLRPASHSVQSLKNFEWYMREKDLSSSSKLEADSESNLVKAQSTSDAVATVVDIQGRESQNGMPINPPVEISLCRHLLFEGMGAEAACQAFDAEKVDSEKFAALGPLLVKNDRLVVRIGGCYFPWDAAAPIILGMISFGQEQIFEPKRMIAVDRADKTFEGDPSKAIVSSGGNWRMWPFSFKKSKTMTTIRSTPDRTKETKADSTLEGTKNMSEDNTLSRITKKKVRSVTPTSEQLASLNLKGGQNRVTFSFSTAMLGKQQVDARIYLWKWNTRIVVSDVDGTITKSDVLGQFMPLVGKDWSQSGVAHLFSAIKENEYQLLFLSARAISQAYLTRQFLFNLKQDGKALPDGPVLISPDGLFPSLYREVIRRAPHEFKISCLEDIRALFPPDCNPFYAGFGNRDTDEISYLKVGIPKGKIFIINPKGEVAVNRRVDTKSYTSLHSLVNGMFPAKSSAEQEEYNSWNYWKLPPPDIDI